MKQRVPGKLRARAEGPYTFRKYIGEHHLGAEVVDSQGRVREVAIANALPYRGDGTAGQLVRPWGGEGIGPDESGGSAEVSLSEGWTE